MHGNSIFGGRSTAFTAFYLWLIRSHSTLPQLRGMDTPLFPCLLSYPEALPRKGSAVTGAGSLEMDAKRRLNDLFAWCNFVELGLPRRSGSCEPQAWSSSERARHFADDMLGEAVSFGGFEAVHETPVTGRRAKILTSLKTLEKRYDRSAVVTDRFETCEAGCVKTERLAMPAVAGSVDTMKLLPPERAKVMADMLQLREPEHLWPSIPIACHKVDRAEERRLCVQLLRCKMAVLVPEFEPPRCKDGRLLLGGLFSVAKDELKDRLIFDRRPENSTMRRLDWCHLPSASCFSYMLLKEDEVFRGSGDDLSNYYYHIALPSNYVPYNAFGRRVDRSVLDAVGADSSVHYRMCFRVLGMGDTNACDIGQAVHEGLVSMCSSLKAKDMLRYRGPPPGAPLGAGSIWMICWWPRKLSASIFLRTKGKL